MVTGRIVPAGAGLNGLREHWVPVARSGDREQFARGQRRGRAHGAAGRGSTPQDRITVKLHYRTPSTIGVVEGDWTAIDAINHVAGTIQGRSSTPPCPETRGWTDRTRCFDRDSPNDLGGANGLFLLASADYDVTASGIHPPTAASRAASSTS